MKESNNTNALFLENVSPSDFDTTVNLLLQEIEKKSWNISNVYDLQKTLDKHGYPVLPVKVLSLCHPKHSVRILGEDPYRIVSSMMPCRVSVYQKQDGKTYISRMNTSMVASSLGGVVEEVMTHSAQEVEEIIASVLQNQ